MPDVMHLIAIKAPPERVYQALTTAEGVRHWWTRDADLDARIGGVGEFRFYQGRITTKVRVDELDPPVRVAWTATASTAPGGWDGTRIIFDLQQEGDDTVLRFAHRGFAQACDGYARVTTGWAYFLVSLQQFLEAGTGAPHPDIDFSRLVRHAPTLTTKGA